MTTPDEAHVELVLDGYELSVVIEALRDYLSHWAERLDMQLDVEYDVVQRHVNNAVRAYTNAMMLSRDNIKQDTPELEAWLKLMTLSNQKWAVLDKVVMFDTWEDLHGNV